MFRQRVSPADDPLPDDGSHKGASASYRDEDFSAGHCRSSVSEDVLYFAVGARRHQFRRLEEASSERSDDTHRHLPDRSFAFIYHTALAVNLIFTKRFVC